MSGKISPWIRRRKYRLHMEAGYRYGPTDYKLQDDIIEYSEKEKEKQNVSFSSVPSTIFKNTHIPPEALKQKLPTYSKKDEKNLELRSAIAENSLSDSIRGKRRKIPFHEVVASAKDFLKKREANKKKKKASILNDLHALQAALPTVGDEGEKNDKPRTSKPFAQQNAEMMEDIQAYHQCISNPAFEADPFGAVTSILTQHILKS